MRLRTKVWYACAGAWIFATIILLTAKQLGCFATLFLAFFYWQAGEINAAVDETLLENKDNNPKV